MQNASSAQKEIVTKQLRTAGGVLNEFYMNIQVNLGRILVKAECFSEAIQVFDQLDFMQSLDEKPAALLAYGQALAGAGDVATAQTTLATALDASPDVEVQSPFITWWWHSAERHRSLVYSSRSFLYSSAVMHVTSVISCRPDSPVLSSLYMMCHQAWWLT